MSSPVVSPKGSSMISSKADPNELQHHAHLRELFHRERAFERFFLPIINRAALDSNNFHPTPELMRAACVIQVVLKHNPERYLGLLLLSDGPRGIVGVYGAIKNAVRHAEQQSYNPSLPFFLENALVWLLSIVTTAAECERNGKGSKSGDRGHEDEDSGEDREEPDKCKPRSVLACLPDPPRVAVALLKKAVIMVMRARHSGLSMLVEGPAEGIKVLAMEQQDEEEKGEEKV